MEYDIEVRETEYAGHAESLAVQGAEEGFHTILSAGGDGTMHQVVNGVLSSEVSTKPLLGLIPLGSGNDLARAFNITGDVQQLVTFLKVNQPRLIDVGLAQTVDANGNQTSRYYINECSVGMGPDVVRRVNSAGRSSAATLMYLKAIVTTFLTLKPEWIEVYSKNFQWSGLSRVLAVANGKCFGHGIYIAPDASPSDGMLNVFLAANPGMIRFLVLLQELKTPKQSKADCLRYFTSEKVLVTSRKPLAIEADGELIGLTPLQCEIKVAAVKFLC